MFCVPGSDAPVMHVDAGSPATGSTCPIQEFIGCGPTAYWAAADGGFSKPERARLAD